MNYHSLRSSASPLPVIRSLMSLPPQQRLATAVAIAAGQVRYEPSLGDLAAIAGVSRPTFLAHRRKAGAPIQPRRTHARAASVKPAPAEPAAVSLQKFGLPSEMLLEIAAAVAAVERGARSRNGAASHS
jgi:hypothetical protein